VLTDDAFYFTCAEDVSNILDDAEMNIELANEFRVKNIEKIRKKYNWPAIIDSYERLFYESVSK
ncbi:MAG TPA: hypothetical protein VFV08_14575, partial [Puia sp.]|nr:hypothetical protein [Puia sp.]